MSMELVTAYPGVLTRWSPDLAAVGAVSVGLLSAMAVAVARVPLYGGWSGQAVHLVQVTAGHAERGVVLADGVLVRAFKQAVHLSLEVAE
jgi:hypothetical protein